MTTMDASKDARLTFRASAAQRILLERAALARDKTLTEFVLDAACVAAENTLLDQRLFFAGKTNFSKFEKALNAPAKVSKELRELLSQTAPWE
ncbi:MAG: DUF1778 domain-containing protein [Candidatus Nanopelagicaceae bacterium]|nr:DUF1778 domain-containing protein [Candidatus Nanopelagicaceae bacterium]